jgi:Tol biopolymer transport system component/DNA-binding winged helix-turn-helix (wHTH) protein
MDTNPRFRFGRYELDSGTFKLLRDGETIALEPKGVDLLRLLLERAPRVVEKPEIFSIVWKDVAVTDNALTRLVTHVRKVLEDDPKAPRYIETIATRGYRFVATVTRLDDRETPQEAVAARIATAPHASAPRRWKAFPVAYAAVGTLVVLSTAALIGSRMVRKPMDAEIWMTDAGIPDVVKLAALKPEQMTAGKTYDGFLSFAPDGKSLAFSSDRSGGLEVYVQSAAQGSTSTALTENGRHAVQPAWSPDGQFIAYHEMSGNGIWIVPSRGGVARKVSAFGANPSWSPDGRWIAFQSLPVTFLEGFGLPGALSTIWLVDAIGHGQPVQLTKPGDPAGPHLAPRWLQDSRHLLFAATSNEAIGGGTGLWNIDIETRSWQQVVVDKRLTPDYVVAPGGQAVYFVARDSDTIWWMPLGPDGTWKADPQPTGLAVNASRIAHLAISADGHRIGWTGLESFVQVWTADANGADGSRANPAPLVQGLGVWYGLPSPAEDGRLAFNGERAGANIDLFLLAPPAPMRQLTVDKVNHGYAQWMPGTREIAHFTELPEGPGFAAIDTESGETRPLFPLSQLPHPPGPSQASTASPGSNVTFSPDFSRVAMAIVQDGKPNVWLAGLRHQRPDGTLKQLTFENEGGSYPVWSADGRSIAYQCNVGSDTNVCVIDADGGERYQLTDDHGQSWVGGWKPDNDTVLFAAERGGVWNLESVSRRTRQVRSLTQFTAPQGHVRYPRWDAANHRAVFQRAQTTGRIWTVELPQ